MLKVKRTAALLAVSLMLPAVPSAFAAGTIPEGTVIYEDNLSGQQVGGTPSGMFNVNQTTFEQSGVGINTNDDAVIAADPSMPTGKYISLKGSNNLYADFNKDNEGSALRVNATGTENNLYVITWNQLIDEGQQEHTTWTRNRASTFRFINSTLNTKYSDASSYDLGTAHFNGSKLNIMHPDKYNTSQAAPAAASEKALERGNWYTFKAYINANQGSEAAKDSVKIIAYKYGTNQSDEINAEYNGTYAVNADSMRIYNFNVDEGYKKAVSDIKIVSYSGDAIQDYLDLDEAAKSVSIEQFTSEPISSVDGLNNLKLPEGVTAVWSSNNESVISVNDAGKLTLAQPETDTKLCLTLTLVKGNASTEIYVPVTAAAKTAAAGPTVTQPADWQDVENQNDGYYAKTATFTVTPNDAVSFDVRVKVGEETQTKSVGALVDAKEIKFGIILISENEEIDTSGVSVSVTGRTAEEV